MTEFEKIEELTKNLREIENEINLRSSERLQALLNKHDQLKYAPASKVDLALNLTELYAELYRHEEIEKLFTYYGVPENIELSRRFAYSLFTLGKYGEAETLFPDNQNFMQIKSQLYSGKHSEVIENCTAELESTDITYSAQEELLLLRAISYGALGDTSNAKKDLKQSNELRGLILYTYLDRTYTKELQLYHFFLTHPSLFTPPMLPVVENLPVENSEVLIKEKFHLATYLSQQNFTFKLEGQLKILLQSIKKDIEDYSKKVNRDVIVLESFNQKLTKLHNRASIAPHLKRFSLLTSDTCLTINSDKAVVAVRFV